MKPRVIELPESLNEVPELQYGVMSAPTQPAPTNRPQPTALLSGGQSLPVFTHQPRTDVLAGDSTVVSLPTAHGPDSLNPFIEGTRRGDATQVLGRVRASASGCGRNSSDCAWLRWRSGPRYRVPLRRQPDTQGPNTQGPNTFTTRLTQHFKEPRSVRILVTAGVVLALIATIVIFSRRGGSDKQLYADAVAANTVAAYQHYLQACRSCDRRADAQAAVTNLQAAGQAAALQVKFKDLLDHGQLKAPADPNAGSALHDLETAAPNDPHIAGDKSALAAALKSEEKQAAQEKAKREADARRLAKAAKPKPKPAKSGSTAAKQGAAASTALASAGVEEPKPVFAPPAKYPSDAKGVSGWVDVEFNVNVDGSTSSAEVVDSNPKGVFDDAAMHAIHTWVFTPYTENGVRSRKRIRMRIQFKP